MLLGVFNPGAFLWRNKFEELAVGVNSLLGLIQGFAGHSFVIVSLGILRIDGNGLARVSTRLDVLSLLIISNATVKVSLAILGI